MAISIDKYGNLVDSVSGKYVGVSRQADGESDASYIARGENQMNSYLAAYNAPGSNMTRDTSGVREAQTKAYGGSSSSTSSSTPSSSYSSNGKPTVTVVPGSVEEQILRAQYGNSINIQYGNANQYTGADRYDTNAKYQAELAKSGLSAGNVGDLWGYNGIPISGGSTTKDYQGIVSNTVNNQNTINNLKTSQQAYLDQQQAALNSLYAQQEAARLGQISTARTNALNTLNTGKGEVENNYNSAQALLSQQKNQAGGQYQGLRNNAQVQAVQNSQKLKEIMAAQGLFNSGGSITGQLQVDTAKQNAFNQINSDEQNLYADIGRRETDLTATKAQELAKILQQMNSVNSASSAEEAAALADLGAQRSKAQMSLADTMNQNALQIANMEQAMNKDWLGNLWQQKTFDQSNADNQKKWEYQTARDAIADSQWAQEFGLKKYNAYNNSSGYSGPGKVTNDSTNLASYFTSMLKSGRTIQDVEASIQAALAAGTLSPQEADYIRSQSYKTPVDNWQRIPGY